MLESLVKPHGLTFLHFFRQHIKIFYNYFLAVAKIKSLKIYIIYVSLVKM